MPPPPTDSAVEILEIKAHYYVHRDNFDAFARLFDAEGPAPSRGRRIDPHTGRPVCDYLNFDLIGIDPVADGPLPNPHVTVRVRGLRRLAASLVSRGYRLLKEGPVLQGNRWQLLIGDEELHVYEYVEDDAAPRATAAAAESGWRPSTLRRVPAG